MKPSSIILILLEILFLMAMLNQCVAHKEDRVLVTFSHGGIDESGNYDPNVFGSVVSNELREFSKVRFEKPFTADYDVSLYMYDEDDTLLGIYKLSEGVPVKLEWDQISFYVRVVLTKPEGQYFSNFDLLHLPFTFKLYRCELSVLNQWFGLDIPGLDLGFWPFN